MIYLCCKVNYANSHDALLILLKDHVDRHLLVEIMNLMIETQVNKNQKAYAKRKRTRTQNKYMNSKVTVSQQLSKYRICGDKY